MALQKHQSLFDEMTLAKSKENATKRELARVKDQLRRAESNGEESDIFTYGTCNIRISFDRCRNGVRPMFEENHWFLKD